jgi:hypothetical protein
MTAPVSGIAMNSAGRYSSLTEVRRQEVVSVQHFQLALFCWTGSLLDSSQQRARVAGGWFRESGLDLVV